MQERAGAVTLRGKPLTLLGRELRPNDPAPAFELVGQCSLPSQMAPARLSDFRDKVLIVSCVPSVDTPVCDRETRHWEEEREKLLRDHVELLTVSLDLPFAQNRWCGNAGVKHRIASAYRNHQFGIDYGVLVKELHLLARAVFVIGKDGRIKHVEYVPEIAEEPHYERIVEAARRAVAE